MKQDKRGKVLVNSQMEFCREADEKVEKKKRQADSRRTFVPAEPVQED